MNNKITVNTGATQKTFFLQIGFYRQKTSVSPLHKHYYPEIHTVYNGKINYTVGKKTYSIEDGDILVIPPNTYHCCDYISENAEHCSFLVDCPSSKTVKQHLAPDTVKEFLAAIKRVTESDNYSRITPFLALIYNTVFDDERVNAEKIEDYAFIIEEYLKVNYAKDIRLADLAAELNLSEKHTERLVKKYTGNTFKQELASIRIKTAKLLISSTDMSMTEISEYVGYSSYSGFYKAYKKNI